MTMTTATENIYLKLHGVCFVLAPLSDNLVLRIGLWLLRAMHKVTFALVVSLIWM